MMKGIKAKRRAKSTVGHIILSILSVIWLLPVVWIIMTSFRGEPGAFTSYVVPKQWTLDNYIKLFTETSRYNFPRWFMNTFIVAVFTCAISTIITLATSYAFSRLRFKLRKPMMNVVLVIGMFPGFMSMIAIYYLIKAIGLDQSLAALVLVYSGGAAMGYYISKGFFDTIPKAIDESAIIDGATRHDIFWKITLPLSKPIIVYTVLTSFLAPWVDFIFVSFIMRDNYNNYTVALGLFEMLKRENINQYFTQFCAGAVIIAIPITILFIIMQKYYVSGVTGGSVKG
ncbi:sugar ABC transporter permease [Erysipelothrix inopinata]|uniref:sugar ABC transporter permease n=1 Tax=Erysipelothrix inopinata TaxID=225084 RepID=UPI001CB6CD9B|nr:sugar ABC transporter permease [Erysipelothrix inopinata]